MKKRISTLICATVVALLLASCASSRTRGSLYPKLYEEKPVTILVMPPINNTSHVEAKELLYTSISQPLVEAGYYVVSPHLAMELLKAESAYDAEMFIDRDASVFGRVFGADAVVFSVIDIWRKTGLGIETKIRYIVRSTRTNEVLFERSCDFYLDLQKQYASNEKKTVLGELINLTATVVTTALTDHIVAARKCNQHIFSDMPRGKYSPDYMKDHDAHAAPQDIRVIEKP